jgi:adhesin/invasin
MPQCSTRNSRWLIGALSGALLLGGAACDDNNFNAVVILASGISVNSGSDGQTGTVNEALANPIVVHVTDANGNSSANSLVIWSVTAGGGSVTATTSLTDANGNASVVWTLGPTAGTNSLRASISSGAFVVINATAETGVITATIDKTGGDAQTVAAGATSAPMVVTILDLAGNPVANATVTWASSGGTLSATSTTTDASGQTQVTLTTGPTAAIYTVTVQSPGAAAVTFTITAT